MRKIYDFDKDWLFVPARLPIDTPDESFETVTLPHTNKIFPHHDVNNQDYQFISTYRKRFYYVPNDASELIFLDFDGVMLACEVYLNGEKLIEHKGGYAPFSVDLTSKIRKGENVLTVYVDSHERQDIPPYGSLVDYLTYGGIYRDVYLRIVPEIYLENTFVVTKNVLSQPSLVCKVQLSQAAPDLTIKAVLLDCHQAEIASSSVSTAGNPIEIKFDNFGKVKLWSLEEPTLYAIRVSLLRDEKVVDETSTRFGFRSAEFRPDGGFYLNGEKIKLFGLNRHQTFPYIGAAAPARLQRLDADILKNELACNIVRTSHYPQSPHFLNRCDEIGLLVFEEITGWHHIGDENWQKISLDELKTVIKRDRNHPSIVLWGVRINESADNPNFYTQTNALAHQLDPTRQTGGVRDFLGSNLLEDVYTYNDFSGDLQEPVHLPHLITEFAGHMFPTKIWDHEERLIDHALLHAKIHNQQLGDPKISGAIGWCAFDYATHKEFGSGDRICYHGVMDIFRLPKWAASFYKSQISPSKSIVLQPATHWTMGDRSGGGNNPLTVFSNCDEIEVIIGENDVGKFTPDFEHFPNLPHPPFTIDGLEAYSAWAGLEFYDLHLIGFINGNQVADQVIPADRLPKKLELSTDTNQLIADGSDMTRLIFRITDSYGNPLPYATKVIHFFMEGPAELIGENPFALIGGQGALFIRSGHTAGIVTIIAETPALPPAQVRLSIV